MYLADPGFTDTENVTNLTQVQFLVIIKRHHQAFTFRQALDRIGKAFFEVTVLQVIKRLVRLTGILCKAFLTESTRVLKTEYTAPRRVLQNLVVFG